MKTVKVESSFGYSALLAIYPNGTSKVLAVFDTYNR